jgi:hypothetical protein
MDTTTTTPEQASLAFAALDVRAALAVLQAVAVRHAARKARTGKVSP